MLEDVKTMFLSIDFLSAITYLIIGGIFGAGLGVLFSAKARKPKLTINGGGGGGNVDRHTWNITILNRPSFLGCSIDGESAREVHASIRLIESKKQSYPVFWIPGYDRQTTIEAGQRKSLVLFHCLKESDGYCIVDDNQDPVTIFQEKELKFVLSLVDRLNRKTFFNIRVLFDNTHLKNPPSLRIITPTSLHVRMAIARGAIRNFFSAFRSR